MLQLAGLSNEPIATGPIRPPQRARGAYVARFFTPNLKRGDHPQYQDQVWTPRLYGDRRKSVKRERARSQFVGLRKNHKVTKLHEGPLLRRACLTG
jgi:hypothetical protein